MQMQQSSHFPQNCIQLPGVRLERNRKLDWHGDRSGILPKCMSCTKGCFLLISSFHSKTKHSIPAVLHSEPGTLFPIISNCYPRCISQIFVNEPQFRSIVLWGVVCKDVSLYIILFYCLVFTVPCKLRHGPCPKQNSWCYCIAHQDWKHYIRPSLQAVSYQINQ